MQFSSADEGPTDRNVLFLQSIINLLLEAK